MDLNHISCYIKYIIFQINFQVGKNHFLVIPKKVIDSLCQVVWDHHSQVSNLDYGILTVGHDHHVVLYAKVYTKIKVSF